MGVKPCQIYLEMLPAQVEPTHYFVFSVPCIPNKLSSVQWRCTSPSGHVQVPFYLTVFSQSYRTMGSHVYHKRSALRLYSPLFDRSMGLLDVSQPQQIPWFNLAVFRVAYSIQLHEPTRSYTSSCGCCEKKTNYLCHLVDACPILLQYFWR